MRPSLLIRSALPPLPPRQSWQQVFPNKNFSIVNRLRGAGTVGIQKGKRTQVADEALANRMVQRLDVRKEDVLIEAYPGMGFLTRALLNLSPPFHPRKVLTIEPSLDFNINGLGLNSDLALEGEDKALPHAESKEDAKRYLTERRKLLHNNAIEEMIKNAGVGGTDQAPILPSMDGGIEMAAPLKDDYTLRAFPSKDDPSLVIIDGTMFDWKTVAVLEADGLLSDVQRRTWEEPPPNLHMIATIPDSDMGEQLVSQWIGCVATRSWLFRWGRVKMSFLVKPTLYDRLTAKPGTKAYCKLSVITAALCNIQPACEHYMPGPDACVPVTLQKKWQKEREPVKPTKKLVLQPKKAKVVKVESPVPEHYNGNRDSKEPYNPDDLLLSTDINLYYPKPRRTSTEQKQPPRPGMMALTLTPRTDPQIDLDDKDVWDYVLRRMFVMSGSPLSVAINNLGMGAANLIPKLTDPSLPAAERIDPNKWIREFTVQDWALVVKAFKAWPFAPDVLVLGSLMEEDNDSRQVGSGM
ncbi:hypothetical protein QFC21_002694 [Naganishia friedmannii]|uniref:Uncharacterized protein n=1 Tax=Naganishia friedmannii TaxID=89922 RepID=A0ACC2VXD1_9TREE|nr:hypothetical protein QFC21_002694 [Naganishia friedmannii]